MLMNYLVFHWENSLYTSIDEPCPLQEDQWGDSGLLRTRCERVDHHCVQTSVLYLPRLRARGLRFGAAAG